jgi:hypothetical protein
MDNNTTLAVVGLGALGTVLAIYGFTYYQGENIPSGPGGEAPTDTPVPQAETEPAPKEQDGEKEPMGVIAEETPPPTPKEKDNQQPSTWGEFWKAEYEKQQEPSGAE